MQIARHQIWLCYVYWATGDRRMHCLIQITNQEELRCFFWIATHLRNQVHFYVDEVADAWETHICRCMRKTYMQMPYNRYRCTSLQLQQCKCIFGCMCIYEPPKDMQMQKQHSDAQMNLPWFAVYMIMQAAMPVAGLVRICLQFIRASIHGKKMN